MRVYHGSVTWEMLSLVQVNGDFASHRSGCLYVTDTFEQAARYANSRATQVVTLHALPLSRCAVVFTLEVDQSVRWYRRPEDHPTLDQCEGIITRGTIVEVHIGRPDPLSKREHSHIATLREQLHVPILLLDPCPELCVGEGLYDSRRSYLEQLEAYRTIGGK
jgi:hypothetical protein